MDGAEYRCIVLALGEECGEVVEQNEMAHHLTAAHRKRITVEALLECFVLHRASTSRKSPPKTSAVDETAPLFDRGDFR